jgi:ubiquinone biosynthesis protein Coq4
MPKPSISSSSRLFSRYGQQWKKIIAQQWEEVWQMTVDRVDKAPNLVVNGLR